MKMRIPEVKVSKGCNIAEVDRIIELLCAREGLSNRIKSRTKSKAASTHWHFSKGADIGTLEVTLSQRQAKIWFSVHDNRRGPWTDDCMKRLAEATLKALESKKTHPV